MCKNSQCVNENAQCNNEIECLDKSDEDCSKNIVNNFNKSSLISKILFVFFFFNAKEKTRINYFLFILDCNKKHQFECDMNCKNRNILCNLKIDCADGEDESYSTCTSESAKFFNSNFTEKLSYFYSFRICFFFFHSFHL